MVDRNNTGNLLSFPPPTPVPGSSAEEWSSRILETRDNLVSALEFLRIAYNERLAGRPTKTADEILAQVDTVLRHDEKTPAHTIVGAIRIHRSASPEAKRKVLLVFPSSRQQSLKTGDGMDVTGTGGKYLIDRQSLPGNSGSQSPV
jgi:hypothetical protein